MQLRHHSFVVFIKSTRLPFRPTNVAIGLERLMHQPVFIAKQLIFFILPVLVVVFALRMATKPSSQNLNGACLHCNIKSPVHVCRATC